MVQTPALRLAVFLCHLGALVLPGCQSHGAVLCHLIILPRGVFMKLFLFFKYHLKLIL